MKRVSTIFLLLVDVCNKIHLAPIAVSDAKMFINYNLNTQHDSVQINNDILPSAVFSIPEVASIGLSEEEAIEQYGNDDLDIYQTSFVNLYNSVAQNGEINWIKIVAYKNKIVGAHIIAREAADIIQIFCNCYAGWHHMRRS